MDKNKIILGKSLIIKKLYNYEIKGSVNYETIKELSEFNNLNDEEVKRYANTIYSELIEDKIMNAGKNFIFQNASYAKPTLTSQYREILNSKKIKNNDLNCFLTSKSNELAFSIFKDKGIDLLIGLLLTPFS